MQLKTIKSGLSILILIVGVTACATPPSVGQSSGFSDHSASATPVTEASEPPVPTATRVEVIAVTGHSMQPAEKAPRPGTLVYDVVSSGNAAPYGDTYRLNRLERPFLKDMTYVPDLDIVSFNLSQDQDWYYVSIELSGKDPNNMIGIDYGVEIDLNVDGFGDYMIWSHLPYTSDWTTDSVQVFKDANHDTGGSSGVEADTSSNGDGYETLVFDGQSSQNKDSDLAWVRTTDSFNGTIQFAFKKELTGSSFMLGVISDAGIKDVTKADYCDHFKLADAGSPEKGEKDYPLKALYAVDSTCWEAYGMSTTGFEPKVCQVIKQPTPTAAPNPGPNLGSTPTDPCYPTHPCGGYPPGHPVVCG